MLLQSFVLGFEVKVPVHESLVGVVNSFKIGVLASLVNFEAVVLGLETLECGSELVSSVVLMAIFGKLHLLILNESSIGFLEVVDLDVESVDLTLQPRDVCLGCMDSALAFIAVCSSHIELLVQGSSSVDQGVSLGFKH